MVGEGTEGQGAEVRAGVRFGWLISHRVVWTRGVVRRAALLSAFAACLVLPPVQAQQPGEFPARSVRIVVPFSAGGANDVIARVVAERLTARWRHVVVVENRAGAGGNIGAEMVARALPDGYTLLLHSTAFVVNPRLAAAVGYDPETHFAPVTLAARSALAFVAHPAFPATTLAEVVRLARGRPLNFASPGNGTLGHLAGELLRQRADVDLIHIQYKGAGPTVNALVGGQVGFGVTAVPSALGLIRAGRLKAIAVTGPARESLLPAVPTTGEAGYPGVAADNMYGFFAPAGTPASLVNQVSDAIVSVLRSPAVREQLEAQGFTVLGNRPEAFTALLREEALKWSVIIRSGNVKAE